VNKATSLYLDVVRFLAALVVMASHATGLVGGFLWQISDYGDEAVTAFFVLSGFVIAHATATRETTMRDYAIARVSRIYSVALPALVLTALVDQIGHSVSPTLYAPALCASRVCSQTAAGRDVPPLFDADHFIGSALFVNELWGLRLQPGTDGPYWSLGFEVWYYVLFAVLTFFSGKPRLVLVLAVTALVGPGILALWPLWLLGVWAYRRAPLSRRKGIALFGLSLVAWGAYEALAWRFGRPHMPVLFLKRPSLLQDYIVGVCFTGSLIGFRSVSEGMQIRHQWRPVRWLAGATFSLYLFHVPLLWLFATVNPWASTSWPGRAFVLGVTLLSVFALAEVTERRKADWRRLVSWLFGIAAIATTKSPPPVRTNSADGNPAMRTSAAQMEHL
jgi:peptidoglycan/LPS O-acetylase OafA/YrhL